MSDPFTSDITDRMIELGQREPKSLFALFTCLVAETGELAEAVNASLGFLPHKQMKEPLEGEVADVINSAIAVLAKAYPLESGAQIKARLLEQLHRKATKWAQVIELAERAAPVETTARSTGGLVSMLGSTYPSPLDEVLSRYRGSLPELRVRLWHLEDPSRFRTGYELGGLPLQKVGDAEVAQLLRELTTVARQTRSTVFVVICNHAEDEALNVVGPKPEAEIAFQAWLLSLGWTVLQHKAEFYDLVGVDFAPT